MRKYLIAGAVAVMVFAFAAFAAQLTVTAPTLQAGETQPGALECVDAVNVAAWGYNDYTGKITHVTLQAVNNDCDDDEFLYLTLLDNNNERLFGHGHDSQAFVVQDFSQKGNDPFTIDVTRGNPAADAGVDASAIGGIRVGIDQGY
jgi:hypothetical protein